MPLKPSLERSLKQYWPFDRGQLDEVATVLGAMCEKFHGHWAVVDVNG